MCIFRTLLGIGIVIGAVMVEIAWLGACFGTVIVGVVLLIFAPGLLLAPFTFGTAIGLGIIASCEEDSVTHSRY